MNRLSTLSAHVAPAPTASGGAWGQEYDFHDPPEPLYNTWSVAPPTSATALFSHGPLWP